MGSGGGLLPASVGRGFEVSRGVRQKTRLFWSQRVRDDSVRGSVLLRLAWLAVGAVVLWRVNVARIVAVLLVAA